MADDHSSEIGLANAGLCGQPERMMARLSPRHVFTLLLAVFVTVGVSLSAVQASNMVVAMASDAGMAMTSETGMTSEAGTTMADVGTGADSDCKACLKGTGDKANLMHCPPTCIAPVLAVLPLDFAAIPMIRAPQPSAHRTPFLRGRSSQPDPSPPKPSDLV